MSGIVESCPTNLTEVLAASARLNCSKDGFGNDQYECLPNSKKTGLVEFCYKGGIPFIVDGYCLETEWGQLYYSKCQHFINGCPSKPYLANDIYKYPACLNINTESQCFLADPSCPNLTTTFTTNDIMDTASTYSGFSNTTVNTLYNTTTSREDVPDVGAVVGAVLAEVFVITALLILVCVVYRRWRRRNQQTEKGNDEESQPLTSIDERRAGYEENSNPPAGNDVESQPLTSIGEQRDGYEENSNPPAESKKPEDKEDSVPDEESQKPDDRKESVPDEVENDIKKQGIDFLLNMSPEHEKYHKGIAQRLKVPVEVLGMPNADIQSFIRNYKKGSTKVYCGRGMVVGCFEAGKTTLVKKLKGEDVSQPPESTRGLEVHTNIFIVNEDGTSLTVNKDKKNEQRLQIILEKSGSEVEKTSLNAEHSIPKADEENPGTIIPPAMNYTESSAQKHEKKYDLPGPSSEKPNDIFSKVEQKSSNTGKNPVKHPIKDQITDSVKNKTDENQQSLRQDIGSILPSVSDKPIKTISLLDFAGQDAYYACHHIFLSPRSFYILVTDMSKKLTEKPTNPHQKKDLTDRDWDYQGMKLLSLSENSSSC
ncbi:uncharacterized protein LOC125656879 [Ostrea edulis]|uniref:uncharacterized protein LOC125656879 n=1 Tax=Ostrea edulis TaxID=37623 RepID=UPI0024AF7536|nr:uncharacterized protein LOC125656879 [Ostrea edulis]